MAESDLKLICQAVPVTSTGDVSTQASNILKGLTGDTVEFEIATAVIKLFAPVVNQSQNVVTASNSSSNGAFPNITVTLYKDGVEVNNPYTSIDTSDDGAIFTAIARGNGFIDSDATILNYVTPTLSAPTISYVYQKLRATHASATSVLLRDGIEVINPYVLDAIDNGIVFTAYATSAGFYNSNVTTVTVDLSISRIWSANTQSGDRGFFYSSDTVGRVAPATSYTNIGYRMKGGSTTYSTTINIISVGPLKIYFRSQSTGSSSGAQIFGGSYPSSSNAGYVQWTLFNLTKGEKWEPFSGTRVSGGSSGGTAGTASNDMPSTWEVGDVIGMNIQI